MFFESHHSTERNFFKVSIDKNNRGFPTHIHKAYECYAVKEGCAQVKVDGKNYTLLPGWAVLVFPYQSHEYITAPNTSTFVCIFSPDLVPSFEKHVDGYLPKSNMFMFSANEEDIPKNILRQKSLCYDICGRFDEGAEYIKNHRAEKDLISTLLIYISDNYRTNCSLRAAAQHAGYDYNYVSKLFKKTVGISFSSYVNNLRISEACRLLSSTDMTVQAISEACGYFCVRTFHREFFNITKMTPGQYRA